MSANALKDNNFYTEDAINAAFMRNHRGEVCIAFTDPAYVRADAVSVNPDSLAVFVIVYENKFFVGHVSENMVQAFKSNDQALLTSLRPDGTVMELMAPIQVQRQ